MLDAPYAGVAPIWFHGVILGLILDVAAVPQNIPVPPIILAPTAIGISIPCLHFSASSKRSKHPENHNQTLNYHPGLGVS